MTSGPDGRRRHDPRQAGEPALSADGVGSAGGGACEDTITVRIRVRDDVIEDIAADCEGCRTIFACAEALAGLARGRHLDDAAEITGETIVSAVGGLPSEKRHVADNAAEALANAIWDYVIRHVEKALPKPPPAG